MKKMISSIREGEKVSSFFALSNIRRSSNNGNTYLMLDLYDKSGSIKGVIAQFDEDMYEAIVSAEVVRVYAGARLSSDALVLDITEICPAGSADVDIMDFFKTVPGGIGQWQSRIYEIIAQISNPACKCLVQEFLSDEAFYERFLTAPGTLDIRQAHIGGLLAHTARIMQAADDFWCNHQEMLDKDILLTGCFLHDIGKTQELPKFYQRQGSLADEPLEHVRIGLMMLNEKLARLNHFPIDLAEHLKHMILAHHGKDLFNGLINPGTCEAYVLYMLNYLDVHAHGSNAVTLTDRRGE